VSPSSNEVEEPWLDEGLTSWFTHRVLERTFLSLWSSRRFDLGTDVLDWMDYGGRPTWDPIARRGPDLRDGDSYRVIAYSKPMMVLLQLEAMLGRPVMEQAIRDYARAHAFRHPTAMDFRKALEQASGRDLSAFWRDFIEGTGELDYAIAEVETLDVLEGGWMFTNDQRTFMPPQPVSPGRRGRIVLERRGTIQVPITLWVRLEDRSEHRLVWDGRDRWTAFTFDHPVVAAVLDPDGNHPMIKDRLHTSYTVHPVRRGFHYWSQLIWGGLLSLLQGIGLG